MQVLQKANEKLLKCSSFRYDFLQSTYIVNMEETLLSEGFLIYRSPQTKDEMPRIYLEYFEPKDEQQVLVFDGSLLWAYRKNTNQVVKQKVAASQMKRNAMVFIPQWLEELYKTAKIKTLGQDDNGLHRYEATPLEVDNEFFRKVELFIDPLTYELKRYIMVDLSDNLIEVNVQKSSYDLNTPENKFIFKVPKGAEVIENLHLGVN